MEEATSLSGLAAKWPSAFVARREVGRFSGGILHPRTLANLDSLGIGPKRIKIGKTVAYPVEDLVLWMEARSSAPGVAA